MSDLPDYRYSAWRLGYTGGVAAMLPGVLLALSGVLAGAIGLAVSIALMASFRSTRMGLSELTWFRWFVALLSTLALAWGLSLFLEMPNRWLATLAWLVASIAIFAAFYPVIADTEGQAMTKSRKPWPT